MRETDLMQIVITKEYVKSLNDELIAKKTKGYFKNYNIRHLVSYIMMRINNLVEGHGIEEKTNNGLDFLYINLGNAHTQTIVFDNYEELFKLETVADTVKRQRNAVY
jgi:hypothetical protein